MENNNMGIGNNGNIPENNLANNNVNISGNNNLQLNSNKTVSSGNSNGKKYFLIGGIVILIIILIIGIIFALNSNHSSLKIFGNNPKSVVEDYLKSIQNSNYSEAFENVYIPENGIVFETDFAEFIETKDIVNDLRSFNISSVKEKSNSNGKSIVEVKLTENAEDKNSNPQIKYFNVNLKQNLKKNWKVLEDNFYIENWTFLVPMKSKVYIDDNLVNNKLVVSSNVGSNSYFDKYEIPALYSNKKDIRIETEFTTKNVNITPILGNKDKEFSVELENDKIINEAFDFIKNTWNDLYKSYLESKDISDIKHYFVDGMDLDTINVIYNKSFDSLSEGSSGYKYIDYHLNSIKNSSKARHYVTTNDIISLNFVYNLTWKWEFDMSDVRSMNRFSNIRLQYKNGEFKIYEVTDYDLFAESNQFTDEQ